MQLEAILADTVLGRRDPVIPAKQLPEPASLATRTTVIQDASHASGVC